MTKGIQILKGKVGAMSGSTVKSTSETNQYLYQYIEVGDSKYGPVMFDELMDTALNAARSNGHEVEIAAAKNGKWLFGSMLNTITGEETQVTKPAGTSVVVGFRYMAALFGAFVCSVIVGFITLQAGDDLSFTRFGWGFGIPMALAIVYVINEILKTKTMWSTIKVYGKNQIL